MMTNSLADVPTDKIKKGILIMVKFFGIISFAVASFSLNVNFSHSHFRIAESTSAADPCPGVPPAEACPAN